MGLESSSWDWLRKGIMRQLPHFAVLDRVENGVCDGMADVNYCIRGIEGWIELKAVPLPVRARTPVLGREGLNVNQVNWHLARQQVLSKTYVFITAAPYRWLIGGQHARDINSWTADELIVHSRFWYDDNWGDSQWQGLIHALAPSHIW
jgi:hypothetical protein